MDDQFQHITMQQLEALVHLFEERNFSRAATSMGLSQPSISKHIKNLEIFIDAGVIDRSQPGISLTAEGKILLGYARRILKLRDEAREKILHFKNPGAGHIFVGASTIPATYILPSVLSALQASHPTLMVHLRAGDSDDVLEMIMNDQVEIGFIGRRITDKKLVCEPLWKDRLLLVAHRDHPRARTSLRNLSEIDSLPFIGREKGSATRSIWEAYLRDNAGGVALNIVSEMGSSEAVKEALIAGLGVSIISRHAVKRELEHGLLVSLPLPGPPLERDFALVYKKQFKSLSHHSLFMDFVRGFHPVE